MREYSARVLLTADHLRLGYGLVLLETRDDIA